MTDDSDDYGFAFASGYDRVDSQDAWIKSGDGTYRIIRNGELVATATRRQKPTPDTETDLLAALATIVETYERRHGCSLGVEVEMENGRRVEWNGEWFA